MIRAANSEYITNLPPNHLLCVSDHGGDDYFAVIQVGDLVLCAGCANELAKDIQALVRALTVKERKTENDECRKEG